MAIADRLREVLDDESVSVSELARRLAGPRATRKQVENTRRYVNKLLGGEVVAPTVPTARKIADALDQPSDTFIVRKPRKNERVTDLEARFSSLADRLEELADGLDELRGVVDELAERSTERPGARSRA